MLPDFSAYSDIDTTRRQALSRSNTEPINHERGEAGRQTVQAKESSQDPESQAIAIDVNRVSAIESPEDAHLACAIEEDGTIQVHGLSSYLHHPDNWKSTQRRAASFALTTAKKQSIRDHLFANAAYQRQREISLLLSKKAAGPSIDFDGLPTELAIHLLDLHWNRKHFAYLMTYRPAFYDSLANDGPYANKLLLNALYFSSCCLDSDRAIFQDVNEPRRRGDKFYKRFKALLVDEIDRASLPTIVALVVVGTTLVSTGHQNAGWILTGVAYRMIIDMGLHLGTSIMREDSESSSNISAVEAEMRSRIYWASFMIDNYQALYLGRPPYLRATDARVSRELNDLHEELEQWRPYIDPETPPSPLKSLLAAYTPRPAYAVSTFQTFTLLGEIAASVTTLYTMDCLKLSPKQHLTFKNRLRSELDTWLQNVPPHLQFNPDTDPSPPPNQFVPQYDPGSLVVLSTDLISALYHTLTILLERPFLSNGHLSASCDAGSRKSGLEHCRKSAFRVWRLLDAYQRAFTFRRTPYLLSYAAFCAAVALLHPQQVKDDEYRECIRFFWYALRRIQQGTHFGLHKPLKILQSLMRHVGEAIPDAPTETSVSFDSDAIHRGFTANENPKPAETWTAGIYYTPDPDLDSFLQQDFMMGGVQQESWMMPVVDDYGRIDDSLIGLMNPGQPVVEGFGPW